MQLSGPPRLRGILRFNFSLVGPLEDAWTDESRYVKAAAGRIRRKGPAVLRPRYRGTITATSAEWLALRSDMEGEFPFCPRTRADVDPEWLDEFEPLCRVASDLTTLTPLRYGDVYRVDVEIEGVETYATRPGAVSGGWDLTAQDADGATLSPYGDATEPEVPFNDVLFDGQSYDLTGYDLGTPAVVAARTSDIPGDATAADIQTRTP